MLAIALGRQQRRGRRRRRAPPKHPPPIPLQAESWAFAVDRVGLDAIAGAGVFEVRECKLCADGIVVKGEYGLTAALFAAGHNIGTLMARYAAGTDWRQRAHWGCNDNAHPSRHGTYDGIRRAEHWSADSSARAWVRA